MKKVTEVPSAECLTVESAEPSLVEQASLEGLHRSFVFASHQPAGMRDHLERALVSCVRPRCQAQRLSLLAASLDLGQGN